MRTLWDDIKLWLGLMLVVGLTILIARQALGKKPTWWMPSDAPVVKEDEVYGTIKCMVQDPEHNTWWKYKRTVGGKTTYPYRDKYYTDEQLRNYTNYINGSIKAAKLPKPDKWRGPFIATLYQQTKFQYDLESRNNVKRTPVAGAFCGKREDCVEVEECAPPAVCTCRGFRKVAGKRLKKRTRHCAVVTPLKPTTKRNQRPTRTVDGQDYGIFQHNWPVRWATNPETGKPYTLEDLLDPRKNIMLAGRWFRRKMSKCSTWYTDVPRRKRARCNVRTWEKQGGIACKCERTHRATGVVWVNGNPANVGRIQRRVEQCVLKVRANEPTEVVSL